MADAAYAELYAESRHGGNAGGPHGRRGGGPDRNRTFHDSRAAAAIDIF